MAGTARAAILAFALVFGLAALTGAAAAQNASVAGTLEAYPTYHCVGVRLPYTGDADGDAVAHVEWRLAGETAWRRGVDLARITSSRWAGSVLWVPSDTLVELAAIIGDADGSSVAFGSVRTRPEPRTTPVATVRWVATTGSDANAGTSAAPLATLQAAADRADPGDEIRVRPGIYYQSLHATRSGTADTRIRVVADGPGVVLDGSDPALLHAAGWQDEGGGVFSLAYAGTTRLVAADSLQRLYRHASLAELRAGAHGIAQGWTVADGRLYVRLEDGSSPAGHTLHVARYDNGVFLEASHWRVGGLEVRHFGTTSAACGIHLRAASGCWIEGNDVHTCAGRGIWLRVGAADDLVERNHVWDPRVGGWPWDGCKSHEEEITGISNRGGRGNVVRANTVEGWFDGLDADNGQADQNTAADSDFEGNVVTGCGDDAIETDTVSGINLRVWDNVFDGNYGGVSIAPIYQGPEYVLYNTITGYRRGAFKLSLSSAGQAWICHNTTWSGVAGTAAVWPSGPYANAHFRNNILAGNGLPAVHDEAGESLSGCDFNGDLLYVTGSAYLFQWKGALYTTLAATRTGTGFEARGTAGDPLFVSPASGDFEVQAASPALDAGTAVPGVDECYAGADPDIGTTGFCGPDGLTRTTPAAVEEPGAAPALAAVRPNPTRGAMTVAFTLPTAAGGRLDVVDVAGRRVLTRSLDGLGAGSHVVRLDDGARLAPGVYLVRLSHGGRAATTRVCVIR